MHSSLVVIFKGICTHLTATHEVEGVDAFALRSGDGKPVQHRVFLANSDMIENNIPGSRNVVAHIPKLRIHGSHVTGALRQFLTPNGEWFERVLSNDAIAFEGLDPSKGAPKHHGDLDKLPSMWFKGDRPRLQAPVLDGWTPYAAAYVDFIAEGEKRQGGVKFTVHLTEILAELSFKGEPALVHRRENVGPGTAYPLPSGATIEISNLPANPKLCGDSDYLLHYFATNVDLLSNAPVWKPEVTAEKKIATLQGGGPAGEVYCSNSTYP